MSIVIHKAFPEDAKGIIKILNPIIKSGKYVMFDREFTEEYERDFIINFPKTGIFHIAEKYGEIVGMQNLERFSPYTNYSNHVGILGTYVDLNKRRQGIGKLLSVQIFQKAKLKGYKKFLIYIREDNPNSIRFYEDLGFSMIGTSRKHLKIDDKYINEVFFEKFL